jgi:hypothetical protein
MLMDIDVNVEASKPLLKQPPARLQREAVTLRTASLQLGSLAQNC